MPPKKGELNDGGGGGDSRTGSFVKPARGLRRGEFASGAVHRKFEAHVTAAQNFFLNGNTAEAEKEATRALRLRPTAHLFALLAVIAESQGKFDRASDFRLLQAFLARDMVLWEELLHEFMSKQLFFKSVVCLQRMSALEKNKERHRHLQLQLADLLIGLGEVRRATNVLVPLWNSSRCRDFEVFAQLSSLYFQLGKWGSLQRLIESSVKYAFHAPSASSPAPAAQPLTSTQDSAEGLGAPSADSDRFADGDAGPPSQPSPSTASGVKRVRFAGLDDQDSETAAHGKGAQGFSASPPPFSSPSASALDEFSFDDVLSPSSSPLGAGGGNGPLKSGEGGSFGSGSATTPAPGGVIHQLYGERIELTTEESKRNFLTLLNVHAELLNEQGSFTETVQLLHMAAGCLEVDVMALPPDLLVRLGVAYAFLGGAWEQPCRDVFQHLVEHCSMEDYGDVLHDAAVSLQKVGMHTEAAQLYTSLARYHQFAYNRLHQQVEVREVELSLMQDTASLEQTQAATAALDALRAEESDVATVLAAANLGEAQCAYAQEAYEEARLHAEKVLELDPTHLQARLLLGRYFFYQRHDTAAAVAVLTPREHEPALQRIQLGAFLVQVFQSAKRYVEAIALGVSIFEILLSSEEDGDTQSVAPGTSSRRSTASLYLPTMTRASSAIIPAASLAGMVRGAAGSSVAARTSFSLAASIRATSSVARQQLSRRGLESLTTTVYGASAAASVAAGWDKKEEQERMKDTSTIFQFNRRRRRSEGEGPDKKSSANGDTTAAEAKSEPAAKTAEERREAVLAMAPSAFWTAKEEEEDGTSNDNSGEQPLKKRSKVDGSEAETGVAAVKKESAGGRDENEEEATAPESPLAVKLGGDDGGNGSGVSGASTTNKSVRKRTKKEKDDSKADRAAPSNFTTLNEKERDLDELEEFLTQAEQLAADDAKSPARTPDGKANGGTSAKDSLLDDEEDASANAAATPSTTAGTGTTTVDAFELPSLEEVSKQFDDPAMAQLFLEASNFTPGGGVRGGEGRSESSDPWAALAEANDNAAPVAPALPAGAGIGDKVTMREAMEALGKTGFIALAVAVVDCYSAVGKFTEAREFAFLSLTHFQQKRRLRQLGHRLERPLRLAVLRAALAAGESEDAYRVGLRLLQEDAAEDKRHEVVELMHSVLNRCEDRSSILFRAVADGYGDPALLVLLANRYFPTRSFTRVLNLYLMALRERPTDIFLNFMVGLSYLLCSHQKRTRLREACVSAAIYYLTQYQQLRLSLDPTGAIGEVLYNIARALQFLKLYYLCIPLYERVAYDLSAPTECTVALQRAARLNLYFLYRWNAGNPTLALTALQPRHTNDHGGSAKRAASPFAQ